MTKRAITKCLLTLARQRGPDKTFCPSEAARQLSPTSWRNLMPQICAEATRLTAAGKLRCTQKGRQVNPTTAQGPVRFSLPHAARKPRKP